MNDVDPQAWLAHVLDKIANRHPMSKIDELLPWAYINNGAKRQAA
jgi:transposase